MMTTGFHSWNTTIYESFCRRHFDFQKTKSEKRNHLSVLKSSMLRSQAVRLAHMCRKMLNFLQKLRFSRCTWQMDEESSRMNNDRLQSILNLRSPRSVAECASRLSTINYYGVYLPFLKRISLILWQMIKKGKFIWTKIHEEAWQNVKFLCSLQVKNFIFQPHLPLL